MKILIITENVGRTAPGIVFERLIQGLSSSNEIDLLTSDYDPSIDLSKVMKIVVLKKRNIHPRIYKTLISIFGINPYDYYWGLKVIKKNNILDNKYDIILSFMSFHHYSSIVAGNMIARKMKCKFVIHSVDAIPAPIGWPENSGYRKGVLRMMSNYLASADSFFSSNFQMLKYQLKTFIPQKQMLTDVIYTPSYGELKILPKMDLGVNYFIYTGGIYGVRKSIYLLKGFEKLLKTYPESKLVFVGTQLASLSLIELESETLEKIELVPFSQDLSQYYNMATALIDIDADIENDVFLSSKMTNYLTVNRTIISETGINSPSRHLFKNIDSIMQCNHDSNQICEAMKKAIITKNSINFNDRTEIIQLFNLEKIVSSLNENLEQIIAS